MTARAAGHERPFLTIREVGLLLGLSERSVRRLIAKRTLRVHHFGGAVRVHRDDLDDLIRMSRQG